MVEAPTNLRTFDSLIKVVEALRGPEGCPWDKEQTQRTLTPYAIEEAHELAEAVESGHQPDVVEELGDLLLQVVLHAEIARQAGTFDVHDVIETLNRKMVRRHPHVFSNAQVKDSAEVLHNWQKIKEQEKKDRPAVGFQIPAGIPALMRAQKIGAKSKPLRFDWDRWQDVVSKVQEEWDELKEAIAGPDRVAEEAELGDLLFTLAQLARHRNLEAEQSLRVANQRFIARFTRLQELAEQDGKPYSSLSSQDLEMYWQLAKKSLAAKT